MTKYPRTLRAFSAFKEYRRDVSLNADYPELRAAAFILSGVLRNLGIVLFSEGTELTQEFLDREYEEIRILEDYLSTSFNKLMYHLPNRAENRNNDIDVLIALALGVIDVAEEEMLLLQAEEEFEKGEDDE